MKLLVPSTRHFNKCDLNLFSHLQPIKVDSDLFGFFCVLVTRFPRTHHVVAGGWHAHDRAHRVGGQSWDGPVLRRPARYPTGDRGHWGGKDGLPHQPAQGTLLAWFVCFAWGEKMRYSSWCITLWQSGVLTCALFRRWLPTLWPASHPPPGTGPTPGSTLPSPWWVAL